MPSSASSLYDTHHGLIGSPGEIRAYTQLGVFETPDHSAWVGLGDTGILSGVPKHRAVRLFGGLGASQGEKPEKPARSLFHTGSGDDEFSTEAVAESLKKLCDTFLNDGTLQQGTAEFGFFSEIKKNAEETVRNLRHISYENKTELCAPNEWYETQRDYYKDFLAANTQFANSTFAFVEYDDSPWFFALEDPDHMSALIRQKDEAGRTTNALYLHLGLKGTAEPICTDVHYYKSHGTGTSAIAKTVDSMINLALNDASIKMSDEEKSQLIAQSKDSEEIADLLLDRSIRQSSIEKKPSAIVLSRWAPDDA